MRYLVFLVLISISTTTNGQFYRNLEVIWETDSVQVESFNYFGKIFPLNLTCITISCPRGIKGEVIVEFEKTKDAVFYAYAKDGTLFASALLEKPSFENKELSIDGTYVNKMIIRRISWEKTRR